MKTMILVLAFLLSGVAGGVAADEASIPLTPQEATEFRLLRAHQANLQLRVQLLQKEIAEQEKALDEQEKALLDSISKAHKVDLGKYRLDDQKLAFVPIPAKPPETKPEEKK